MDLLAYEIGNDTKPHPSKVDDWGAVASWLQGLLDEEHTALEVELMSAQENGS